MAMIDDFIERKWGRRKVEYMLPPLEAILKDSLGVIVYQEQVMRIAQVLASFSLGEADLLRRAMGKKDAKAMAKQRERFLSGAAAQGHAKGAGGGDLRADGEVLRIRIQQVALGGLRLGGLPDGLSQDPLPGRVHGRAAHIGNFKA